MVGGRVRRMVGGRARGRAHDTPHKGGVKMGKMGGFGKLGGMVKIGKLGSWGDFRVSCDLLPPFSFSLSPPEVLCATSDLMILYRRVLSIPRMKILGKLFVSKLGTIPEIFARLG